MRLPHTSPTLSEEGRMIRTLIFPCTLARQTADALNRESGRVYTRALVEHYRVYRQTGHWLTPGGLEKLVDFYDLQDKHERLLHAHSVDAAQQGFPKACKTAKVNRNLGVNYPHKRKLYRTTVWKNSSLRAEAGRMRLSLARGREPIMVSLPPHLAEYPADSFVEARLVHDRASRRYEWHLVVEDGREPSTVPGSNVAGIDLGEIHPAAVSDGQETVIFSARTAIGPTVWPQTPRRTDAPAGREEEGVAGLETAATPQVAPGSPTEAPDA